MWPNLPADAHKIGLDRQRTSAKGALLQNADWNFRYSVKDSFRVIHPKHFRVLA